MPQRQITIGTLSDHSRSSRSSSSSSSKKKEEDLSLSLTDSSSSAASGQQRDKKKSKRKDGGYVKYGNACTNHNTNKVTCFVDVGRINAVLKKEIRIRRNYSGESVSSLSTSATATRAGGGNTHQDRNAGSPSPSILRLRLLRGKTSPKPSTSFLDDPYYDAEGDDDDYYGSNGQNGASDVNFASNEDRADASLLLRIPSFHARGSRRCSSALSSGGNVGPGNDDDDKTKMPPTHPERQVSLGNSIGYA